MQRGDWRSSFLTAVVLTIVIYLSLGEVLAQVSSSTNYRLESDSVNFGGGLSASDSFSLESTMGEVATGDSDSTTFSLRAGYQQMQEVFISLTAAPPVLMTPALGGLTGGTANGSTSVLVLTDSPSGYALTIQAANNPAMQKGSDVIADYVPVAAPNADPSFITSSTDVHFGFSPFGPDVAQRFLNDTALCGVGSISTEETCWAGLSTAPELIASGGTNHPAGASTTIFFRVGIGGAVGVAPGSYVATTTLTALPL